MSEPDNASATPANDPVPDGPSISVIVNTCDRSRELRTLLWSLHHQTYPRFEVVVVVGPTRDDTLEMLAAEHGERVHVARCQQFNLSCSRNVGLANAAGEVVAFIDDDAVPCRTWLAQLAAAYAEDRQVAGVGGRTYNANPVSGEMQFLSGRISVLAEQDDVRRDETAPVTFRAPTQLQFPRFHGTNMSYRKDALLAIGGFDERFEYLFDDADIGVRLGLAGFRLQQLRQGVVYHAPGSGRNRGKHPYDLNWYCWLRSKVYFLLKNGIPSAGLLPSLAGAGRTISWFFAEIGEADRLGKLPAELTRRARRMLRRGAVNGMLQGIVARRRLAPGLVPVERSFLPFPAPESPLLPAVPPSGIVCTGTASESRSGSSPDAGNRENPERGKVKPLSEEPLRIALLSVGYPPQSTHGVSRSTHTLAQGLVQLGHEVHVITSDRRRRVFCADGVYIHEVDGSRSDRYWSYRSRGYPNLASWLSHSHAVFDQVRELQTDHQIQIVDSPLWCVEGLVTAVSGTIPVAVRVVTAMKQIADVHDRISDENRLLGELEGELLGLADAVISNSTATAVTLEQVYGLCPEELRLHGVVPYGMVPAADEDIGDVGSDAEDGNSEEELQVLFVGRLEKRKGILDLFRAIPVVLAQLPRIRFVIAGSDNSAEDGFQAEHKLDYPAYFQRRYRKYRSQVDFLGFVAEEELDRRYRSCDLFVAPSLYESFGLIYLEAMNQARPVIGCSAGGPTDIIVDGETGRLVPPQDPPSLAEAIIELGSSRRLRREMGRNGRRRLLQHYSHTAMAGGFVDIYRRMLAVRSSKGRTG